MVQRIERYSILWGEGAMHGMKRHDKSVVLLLEVPVDLFPIALLGSAASVTGHIKAPSPLQPCDFNLMKKWYRQPFVCARAHCAELTCGEYVCHLEWERHGYIYTSECP